MATPSGLVECFYRQTTVNQACIHETPVYWGVPFLSIPCVKWDDGVMSMDVADYHLLVGASAGFYRHFNSNISLSPVELGQL